MFVEALGRIFGLSNVSMLEADIAKITLSLAMGYWSQKISYIALYPSLCVNRVVPPPLKKSIRERGVRRIFHLN